MIASVELDVSARPMELEEDRPRVFVLPSPRTESLPMHAALRALGRVEMVADVATLEQRLAGASDAVVVCEWVDRLARTLERAAAPLTLIHYGETLPAGLLDAIGNGHRVQQAESAERLVAQLRAIRPVRGYARWYHLSGLTLQLGSGSYPLLDLSNDGFSFEVDAGGDVEPFLPGAHLDGVRVSRGGDLVIDGGAALVRTATANARGGYRIGCQLRAPQREHHPGGASRVVPGRAVAAGLIRAALETTGIVLQSPDGESRWQCTGGTIHGADLDFTVAVAEHDLQAHDVVRGHFEVGGSLYRFSSSVVAAEPLRIRIPAQLEESSQRVSGRYRPAADRPVWVELTSPLSLRMLVRQVHDISSTGLSIDVDCDRDLLPVGLQLPQVAITIAGESVTGSATVKNVARLGERRARCGIALDGFEPPVRAQLAELLTRAQFPALQDGARTSFDTLLGFFKDSGFLSEARQQALAPLMPEVRRSFEALASRPNRLLKSVVCREGERIVGHISSIRAYRRTFMIQHLAAAVGREAGLVLSLGNAEYLMQNADFEFIKIWFHSHNRFPARVFGGFGRKVRDPELCNLKTYAHVTIPTQRSIGGPAGELAGGGIEVIEASGEELAIVEQHFVRSESPLLIRSDDLTRGALQLGAVQASYRKLGLMRRRRVLLAMRDGAPLGFALVELSSPGLNLFDSLNRFSIHMLPEGEGEDAAVRAALVATIQGIYRQGGRVQVTGLVAPSEVAAYAAIGIVADKEQSTCVTTHRTQLRRFFEHMERLGVRLRRRGVTERAGRVDVE